ncbi:hypothetical protein MG295_00171 [Bacillus phage vB_BcgM]|nr:hypothetical protein MG295_00171 [Bacillus phage vB_BcgM]
MELKTVYAVYQIGYQTKAELVIVYEDKKEAIGYRDAMNKQHEGVMYYYIDDIQFKPKEIW